MTTTPQIDLALNLAVVGAAAVALVGTSATAAAAEPIPYLAAQDPVVQSPPSSPPEAQAESRIRSWFFDDEDGQFDVSNFLARGGFIPVPIIITEPALGGGGGVAAAFLSTNWQHPRQVTRHVAAVFRTGNGSEGVGYFQSGYAFDGRLNYRFGIGHGEVTLETFPAFAPGGVEYTSEYDYGVIGSALWRLPDERFSVGPLFDFRKLSTRIDAAFLPDDLDRDVGVTLRTGALGAGFHFDSRDNPLTPTKGVNALAEAKFNREAFGSDRDYEQYTADLFVFQPLTPEVRVGWKVNYDGIRGDFPFFYAPAINLRGVQAAQYQGVNVISSEVEATWQLDRRWSVLAFAGYGTAESGERRAYQDSGDIWAGGFGFRYRLARKLGLDVGMDFAMGPEEFIFYLQFGHAWSMNMD
ncbi:BamA/TamA family outer membrane protein [Brevundimonas lenta]|uniref:Bacterial surface antigen (D15) domain-containing protein n=1 Tax=Brevundimonas lenta TaxID=424796 RepID=A0A7W6JGU5_9CAUL|nr:BamA/TamA family outer membrane protein [Brevundimonas lenta]MBB4083923.1 hypothetical protein [Brevundimonas lenta]